jgi:hypothetical protein
MIKFIGISGLARSGKDTAAEYLVKNHGFTRVSFADPMREALLALDPSVAFGISSIKLSTLVRLGGWDRAKEDNPEVRELIQRMGTEVGRTIFGINFWVDQAFKKAEQYDKVVFSDCRFINEAEAVMSHGGSVWRVNRPGLLAPNNHISEKELNDYNFNAVLGNDSTIENFYDKIEKLLELECLIKE